MMQAIPRAIAVALLGALAGPVFLALVYAAHPAVVIDLQQPSPLADGFYPAERAGDLAFAWTSGQAVITLAGADRRSPWTCTVRFRGARPDASIPQPDVRLSTGDAVVARRATNDFEDLEVIAPARPNDRGLRLVLTSSSTFTPGPNDRRTLGVQVEVVSCRPVGALVVLPPRPATAAAALSSGVFGAALGLVGVTAGSAVLATALIAVGQALPLAAGAAPYAGYGATLVRLATVLALLMLVAVAAVQARNGRPLRNTARFAIIFSAGALYLKLAALLHPSKAVVDALFHAHRFESVLAGHWYFTQLSTSATPFPYAIGLYLFAAPWAFVTTNHVALLRVVVSSCDALAGALLYLVVVRTWGDRLVGAIAVALFSFVPLSYVVVGHANLTSAFGQSVALATMAAATVWRLEPRRAAPMIGLILLATLAFISHVSTVVVLGASLVATAVFYWWRGGEDLRPAARAIALATALAAVASVALYWGQFGAVYKAQFVGARNTATPSAGSRQTPETPPRDVSAQPALGHQRIPLSGRMVDAAVQTRNNLGWPIVILGFIGLWRLWASPPRDRLAWALAGWGVACLVLVGFSVASATQMRYQQDAWEFIGRVEHATCAAGVILAAFGAAWAWRAGVVWRVMSIVLLVASVLAGTDCWLTWLG
jgi:hypothetical protein